MGTNTGTIMTLANSIIGVSVLAMPFCFKQCGIALSVLMLIASSLLSRLACHFLLKAAVMARRRTFEFLAFHTFGLTGKLAVELCIIGFLMGTCIAFFVVMGDLGPAIIAKILGLSNTVALRPSVLIGLAVFVVLPLGMLRNVDSLTSVSMATIGFYICLVLKVMGESLPHLLAGDWYEHVNFWRPAGILQCIPIFSMALFCQTQLFEIYESMHNASLDRMNFVIRAACNICTGVYICVGFFGYIAFCTQQFSGNVLMSFAPTVGSEIIKLGFVLSVAVSFPLVIFPCRASLYSLLFRRISMPHHESVGSHIPEARFKCLTVFIISVTLAIGLLIPNIELVLGIVGSTIGVLICVMFPAAAFICMSTKNSGDRILAQVLLFVGALILVLGTYATLSSANEIKSATETPAFEKPPHFHEKVDSSLIDVPPKPEEKMASIDKEQQKPTISALEVIKAEIEQPKVEMNKGDKRQEPPVPMEPSVNQRAPQPSALPLLNDAKLEVKDKMKENIPKENTEVKKAEEQPISPESSNKAIKSEGAEQVDAEAIKKEEEELAEIEKKKNEIGDNKNEELLRKLEKHEAQQMKILEEQKKILQALQEHHEQEMLEKEKEIASNKENNKPNIEIPLEKDLNNFAQKLENINVDIAKLQKVEISQNHNSGSSIQNKTLAIPQQAQTNILNDNSHDIIQNQNREALIQQNIQIPLQKNPKSFAETKNIKIPQELNVVQPVIGNSENFNQDKRTNSFTDSKTKIILSKNNELIENNKETLKTNVGISEHRIDEDIIESQKSVKKGKEFQLQKKSNLLQQIANGGLNTIDSRPLPQVPEMMQPKQIVPQLNKELPFKDSGAVIAESVPSEKAVYRSKSLVPDIKQPQLVAVPNAENILPHQPPAGLLEGLKSPPIPLALQPKTKSQHASADSHDLKIENPNVKENGINAMGRDILQQVMPSTPIPDVQKDTKEQPVSANVQHEVHDREKRDIEVANKNNIVDKSSLLHDAASQMIIDNLTQSLVEDCVVTKRNEDTEIDHNKKIYKNHKTTQNEKEMNVSGLLNAKARNASLNSLNSKDSKFQNSSFKQLVFNSSGIENTESPPNVKNDNLSSNDVNGGNDMIKSASHLSEPQINSKPGSEIQILKEGSISPDAKPMKRDLKSVSMPDDDPSTSRKQS